MQKAIQPKGASGPAYSDRVNTEMSKMHAKANAKSDLAEQQADVREPDNDADDAPPGARTLPNTPNMPSRFSGVASPHQGKPEAVRQGAAPAPDGPKAAPKHGFPPHAAHADKYPNRKK